MDHGGIMYGGRSRQMSPEWRSGKRKLTEFCHSDRYKLY